MKRGLEERRKLNELHKKKVEEAQKEHEDMRKIIAEKEFLFGGRQVINRI